jgi:hypothetical protein
VTEWVDGWVAERVDGCVLNSRRMCGWVGLQKLITVLGRFYTCEGGVLGGCVTWVGTRPTIYYCLGLSLSLGLCRVPLM